MRNLQIKRKTRKRLIKVKRRHFTKRDETSVVGGEMNNALRVTIYQLEDDKDKITALAS